MPYSPLCHGNFLNLKQDCTVGTLDRIHLNLHATKFMIFSCICSLFLYIIYSLLKVLSYVAYIHFCIFI